MRVLAAAGVDGLGAQQYVPGDSWASSDHRLQRSTCGCCGRQQELRRGRRNDGEGIAVRLGMPTQVAFRFLKMRGCSEAELLQRHRAGEEVSLRALAAELAQE